jgi:hypothetical protein
MAYLIAVSSRVLSKCCLDSISELVVDFRIILVFVSTLVVFLDFFSIVTYG